MINRKHDLGIEQFPSDRDKDEMYYYLNCGFIPKDSRWVNDKGEMVYFVDDIKEFCSEGDFE